MPAAWYHDGVLIEHDNSHLIMFMRIILVIVGHLVDGKQIYYSAITYLKTIFAYRLYAIAHRNLKCNESVNLRPAWGIPQLPTYSDDARQSQVLSRSANISNRSKIHNKSTVRCMMQKRSSSVCGASKAPSLSTGCVERATASPFSRGWN